MDQICKTHFHVDGDWIPYCRNLPLGVTRPEIRRVVLLVHGKHRNAKDYFNEVQRIAVEMRLARGTQILAPQFLTEQDIAPNQIPDKVARWTQDGWKHGFRAVNGQKLSSFAVVDRLLKRVIEQNPKLEEIVIAGHSAGAQLVQRHAAARRLNLAAWGGKLRYVISNPGSYMYLSKDRPGDTARCSKSYNAYRYGVEDNTLEYFEGTSPDTLWKRFYQHRVAILLGGDDKTEPDDTGCEAMAQGANRLERGRNFYHSVTSHRPVFLEPESASRLSLDIVPGIGHDFARMWDSHCGRQLLFGTGRCPKVGDFRTATRQ